MASVSSLVQLIEQVSAKPILDAAPTEDRGLAEQLPYPFMALVGQTEMRTALLLTLINPAVNGVLLIGPRGTGKTTAVRSLVDLLPLVARSLCGYGCMPEDIETEGMDAVCPDCAKKYAMGEPLIRMEQAAIVELPLNARLEDVVGGIDERAAVRQRMMLQRGILARADRNLLYVDEVNLLADEIVDAILDAAAQGQFTLRRGPLAATFRARFAFIGSMNPEEGRLRPQILDRFGLRLGVRGLTDPAERLEAYRRVRAYLTNPRSTIAAFADQTIAARDEIQHARNLLASVKLTDTAEKAGLELVQRMKIDSLRAEITMFEAARALAAADNRAEATAADVRGVAPMALRMRRSKFMEDYFETQQNEETEIKSVIDSVIPE
ncbi:MAG TPA: ATP-binding protein [Anaerolineales bacterium]|nr:ATP-binding protein [Anaerolineales bacterium]